MYSCWCGFCWFSCFFSYRMCVVRKSLSFYQARQPKVHRKMVLFRTKNLNYGRDSKGRWRKWLRPSFKPKLYRPYQCSNHPQQSLEEVEHQPFVRSTLRIDPDYLHDEYIRLACAHTTFVWKMRCQLEEPQLHLAPLPALAHTKLVAPMVNSRGSTLKSQLV